jgi:hypothetical protein
MNITCQTLGEGVTPCRSLFKELEILPVACHYILPLMIFVVWNQDNFETNPSIQNINTRNKHHLQRSNATLSFFQKSTFNAVIKIFNNSPRNLTVLKNEKAKFKVALRKYGRTRL